MDPAEINFLIETWPLHDIDREDASSMVTAGATANTTVKNSRASRESGLLCSHSHGESIDIALQNIVWYILQ